MTLWRIENGVPSVADAFLVVGGFLGACVVFIPCIEPILAVFEPLGLEYFGFFLALLVLLGTGAAAVWVFVRNEKKLHWALIVPRRVFAITSAPVIFLVYYLTDRWAFRAGVGFFEHLAWLVICFVPVFGLVVRYSLRHPQRAAHIAIWFQLSLSALGLVAKITSLALKR